MSRDVVMILQLQRVRKRGGWHSREDYVERGSKNGLRISMEALLPGEEFFCLYCCSLRKKQVEPLKSAGQKQGPQQGTVNNNTHTCTPRILRAPLI
jgi:hypothetical protein